ncbi:hypothetical protein F5X97DRAFT_309189 [Nemania serpens]|nr:hypothetical protein F5X97DRAFT_309189 [Nemania serpens]
MLRGAVVRPLVASHVSLSLLPLVQLFALMALDLSSVQVIMVVLAVLRTCTHVARRKTHENRKSCTYAQPLYKEGQDTFI